MTLGEKIKEARAAGGLTQEELASKLMVSRQAVTKWETDKGIPDVENLKLISNLLGISVDYLLDDKERLEKSIIRE
ncbi:MAG: helix-turn-helix transcriptional regulator [Sporolactobacillus sp.]